MPKIPEVRLIPLGDAYAADRAGVINLHLRMFNSATVRTYLGENTPRNESGIIMGIEKVWLAENSMYFLILLNNVMIGRLGVDHIINRHGRVAMVMDEDHLSRGLGTIAATKAIDVIAKMPQKPFKRIIAGIRPNNIRSRNLAEKMGFNLASEKPNKKQDLIYFREI